MTKEEITKLADETVWNFRNKVKWQQSTSDGIVIDCLSIRSSIECAIIAQQMVVDAIDKLIGDLKLFDDSDMIEICATLNNEKAILDELKSRVK